MVYPVNWFRIIADLERAGFTDVQIAKEIGLDSPSSITKYKTNEVEPLHLTGERLRDLHLKHCLSKVS